jgi:hypothetical protein
MTLKIVDLLFHDAKSALAFTVTFDDLDRGWRMVATLSEAAFFESAEHPECEAFDVEPQALGKLHSEQYDTEELVRLIKKFVRDKANREKPE